MWRYHPWPGKTHNSCYTSVSISCLSAMGSRWDSSTSRVFPCGFASSLALQDYIRNCLLRFCQLPVLQWESNLSGDVAKGMAPLHAVGYSTGWAVARLIKGIAAVKCKMEHFLQDLVYRDSKRRCCHLLGKDEEPSHIVSQVISASTSKSHSVNIGSGLGFLVISLVVN